MNRRENFAVCFSMLLLIRCAVADAGELPGWLSDADLRERNFRPLIGSSLDAWNVETWHKGHWTFHDGAIHYDGRSEHRGSDENSLWTKSEFGDVQLYVEWRFPAEPRIKPQPIVLFNGDFLLNEAGQRVTRPGLDAGDSGILFRGTSKCQANIWCQELGSGEINGYRTDRAMPPEVRRACIPLKKADRPIGEWNSFLITLKGDRMTVELNGEEVIQGAQLPNLPESGPIGLQHHGDPVQFRRLWIREFE